MGLTITGGTTITTGETVSITSYSLTVPAGSGSNPVLGTTARNAAANGIVDLVDAGAGAGVLRLKTSSGGTTLVDIALNDPAFDASASGAAALDVSPAVSGVASATGVCAYYEFRDSDGNVIMSGTTVA